MSVVQYQSRWQRLLLPATVISAVLLVAACGAAFVVGQRATNNVNTLFGGADGLQIVRAPGKVEAFRVAAFRAGDADSNHTIGGAQILSGPVAVDEKTARELTVILKNPDTYGWDFAKGCKFDPGIALQFTSPSSTIDVIFCFHCEELQVYRDGRRVGSEDFDAASGKLATIMKRLFPDDDEIQKL